MKQKRVTAIACSIIMAAITIVSARSFSAADGSERYASMRDYFCEATSQADTELLISPEPSQENQEAWTPLLEYMPETSLETVERMELSYLSCSEEFQSVISGPEELEKILALLQSTSLRPSLLSWEEAHEYDGEGTASLRIVYQDGTEWKMEKYVVVWLEGEKEQLYDIKGRSIWELYREKDGKS